MDHYGLSHGLKKVSPTLLFLALSVCPTRTIEGVPQGDGLAPSGRVAAEGAERGPQSWQRAGEERAQAPQQEEGARERERAPQLGAGAGGGADWALVAGSALGRGPLLHPPKEEAGRPRRTMSSASWAVEWDVLNTACLTIIFSVN